MLPVGQTNGLATRLMGGKAAPRPIPTAVTPMKMVQTKATINPMIERDCNFMVALHTASFTAACLSPNEAAASPLWVPDYRPGWPGLHAAVVTDLACRAGSRACPRSG